MFEETTQSVDTAEIGTETSDDFDLFGDDTSTEETESTETVETDTAEAEGATTEAETQQETVEKHTVKYNGQEMALTLDELKTNAQKGLNYDHIKTELDAIKSQKDVISLVDELARESGMTLQDYAKYIKEQREQQKLQEYATKHSIPEEVAQELMESRREREERKLQEQQAKEQQAEQDAKAQQWAQFTEDYKDIKPSDIPTEVFAMVNEKGYTLSAAYAKYENNKLKQEIAALKTNQTNKEKAIGSVQNDGGEGNVDPFLQGLFG